MTTTPAEELRAAAKAIRSAAEFAGSQTWIADHYPEGTIVRPASSTLSLFRLAADGTRAAGTPNVAAPIGEYIAAMHPRVGLALADWLEETAEGYDAAVIAAREVWGDEADEQAREWLTTGHGRVGPQALAVARAVNAAASAP